MHTHSLEAFESVKINESQKRVLSVYNFGDYTDQEVAQILGWPINRISGRIGELLRAKELIEKDTRIQNGRKVRVCGIIRSTLF